MASVYQFLRAVEHFEPFPKLKSEIEQTPLGTELTIFAEWINSNKELRAAFDDIVRKAKDDPTGLDPQIKDFLEKNTRINNSIDKITRLLQQERKKQQQPTRIPQVQPLGPAVNIPQPLAQQPAAVPTNRFYNWRTDEPPEFEHRSLSLPFDKVDCPKDMEAEVRAHCFQQYKKAMSLMEHSVSELANEYIERNPYAKGTAPFEAQLRQPATAPERQDAPDGVLMKFANAYAQRYMDLYEAYIQWEIDNNIPMIPVTAGQMKLHGFTSQEILQMQGSCVKFSEISDGISAALGSDLLKYKKIVEVMTGNSRAFSLDDILTDDQKLDALIATFEDEPAKRQELVNKLKPFLAEYKSLPEKGLIDRAHFLMHTFGHLEYEDIAMQLYYVGIMKPSEKATKEERIQMEIRHRIGGDSSIHQNSPGSLGGNPLAYLNMLREGEPGNPQAEFREKMFFVYMNNHFANAVIKTPEIMQSVNDYLAREGKGWALDAEFISEMDRRGPSYIPPIFRYGANAAINREIREPLTHEEVAEFYQNNPNISVREAMEGIANINAYYKSKLSERELMNQIGENTWRSDDPNRPWTQLNFGTGAAIFRLHNTPSQSMSDAAKQYIQIVSDLGLPVYSGISGTLDQSTAMAGLVGLGVDADPEARRRELEVIKLAYLAFMLPGRDHSAHEILQSSRSYGLEYVAGPGYHEYIYPDDAAHVNRSIQTKQAERSAHTPEYYLSEEYLKIAIQAVKQRKAEASNVATASPDPVAEPAKENAHPNYYVGIPIMETTLGQKILAMQQQSPKNPDIHWVQAKDWHITVGWLPDDISPGKLQVINDAIRPILEKYTNLNLTLNNLYLSQDNKDVLIELSEETGGMRAMRQAIREALQELDIKPPITFDWSDNIHIKIAYADSPQAAQSLEDNFKGVPQGERVEVEEACMLHYDSQRWSLAIDRRFPLAAKSERNKQNERDAMQQIQEAKAATRTTIETLRQSSASPLRRQPILNQLEKQQGSKKLSTLPDRSGKTPKAETPHQQVSKGEQTKTTAEEPEQKSDSHKQPSPKRRG